MIKRGKEKQTKNILIGLAWMLSPFIILIILALFDVSVPVFVAIIIFILWLVFLVYAFYKGYSIIKNQ